VSTIFDIHHLKLPGLPRTVIFVAAVAIVAAAVASYAGWHLYRKLTDVTVVAYFAQANALYPGDRVQIMGVRVGAIDRIEPDGDKMKITFHYQARYKVPANATASILNPSLVASRNIQLSPPYTGGPTLHDGSVIPIERTQVPVEWDDLRNQITTIIGRLGPTPQQPKGPFGDIVQSFADGLAGKGQHINDTLTSLSTALSALNDGRGDFFSVVRGLAAFVNALYQNDRQFVALNNDLASFTDRLTTSDQELAIAITQVDQVLTTTRQFVTDNGSLLAHDVTNLADVTNAIMATKPREGLETALHVVPNLAANLYNIYEPTHGTLTGLPVVSFANPLEFFCSSIQSASRLGYQDSAELCAQYLAPILDAVKFNSLPFGMNLFNTAATLPNEISYSDPRLEPPTGFKDTTVPGVWARDTLFSHGNHEPGWKIAPGTDGLRVGPLTQNMLAPDDLAALLGTPTPPGPVPLAEPPTTGAVPGGPYPAEQPTPAGASTGPGQ
jgi:phospholipid/cholesterol/gamma-HCH transport system substrate-binding protein